jgi:Ca2+/Na+ antiporter
VGSNIFNILAILGAAGLIKSVQRQRRGAADGLLFYAGHVGPVLLPLMRWGLRLNRIEGGLLVLAYGCYLALLWPK